MTNKCYIEGCNCKKTWQCPDCKTYNVIYVDEEEDDE